MQLEERKRQKHFEKEMQDLEREQAVIDNIASTFQQAFDEEITGLMQNLYAGDPSAAASADDVQELKRLYDAFCRRLENLRQAMPHLDLSVAINFLTCIKSIIE